jgi:hypothetical protein
MVVLAIITGKAFSYKDFKTTFRSTLAFKLLKDVYAGSFMKTVKDMKTLVPKMEKRFNSEVRISNTA